MGRNCVMCAMDTNGGYNFIKIRGACENNLKQVSLDIKKGTITVLAGVSGSGKTSLAFDTIAAESMRQLYETFPLYVRNRMPFYRAPDAESIQNLTTAIVVDQKLYSGDVRSTVGTMTDISPLMRLLFSRFSENTAGTSNRYSFNDPEGMCPFCSGLGTKLRFNMDKVLDREKSLAQGAIRLSAFRPGSYQWQMYANSGHFDPDKPLKDYSREEWEYFLHGSGQIVRIHNVTGTVWGDSYNLTYEGLYDRINRLYLKKGTRTVSKSIRKILNEFAEEEICPSCQGKRLNERALKSRIMGYSIWDMGQMEISDLKNCLQSFDNPRAQGLIRQISRRLSDIEEVGLEYLNLNRNSSSLSGGEAQRLKIVKHLGTGLTGITYIFDEPCAGLHPRDIIRVSRLLRRLKERGNTVIVVEHNRSAMEISDEIIELGPGAGRKGGNVLFQGSFPELLRESTPTAEWLRKKIPLNRNPIAPKSWIHLKNCCLNNLKQVSVDIPLHVFTAVTGVAGAGKTSLVCGELLRQYPDAVHISQGAIGTTIRSNPASYVGVMDDIRRLFAKASGKPASLFSFNSKGACPVCGGKGVVKTEMAYLEPVISTCELCGGARYNKEALSFRYRGKTIADVLKMTIAEALEFFPDSNIRDRLQTLADAGLDYLTLGQPTSSLSGGECQRIKLAAYLKRQNVVYVLDEPTSGLHGKDIGLLMRLMKGLVRKGNTVIVIDHKADVIAQADWIIDVGPEGGKNGGEIVFEGTVEELLQSGTSYTAEYLRKDMKKRLPEP